MNERERRIGENEALFRSVNEQVRELDRTLATKTETVLIVCECGNQSCIERIEVMPSEYEDVRADSTQFAIKPGHEIEDAEDVVARNDRFWVVQKRPGLPSRLAEATDVSA